MNVNAQTVRVLAKEYMRPLLKWNQLLTLCPRLSVCHHITIIVHHDSRVVTLGEIIENESKHGTWRAIYLGSPYFGC